MGLEKTPEEFIAGMVEVFREVRRVLRDDGTLWLNIGDSYAGSWGAEGRHQNANPEHDGKLNTPKRQARVNHAYNASVASRNQIANAPKQSRRMPPRESGIKPKDLYGIPWMLAFALRADGWYLRQDIIWHKPNPMPESIRDRCTKAHEYVFLLSKSAQYFYDFEAVQEPVNGGAHARLSYKSPDGWDTSKGEGGHGNFHRAGREKGTRKLAEAGSGTKNNESMDAALIDLVDQRNLRSVWTVATQPFKEAHFATFPPALIEPCIKAGCPHGGVVLDPFGGAGTTGLVADRLQRSAILIELNPEYTAMAARRINGDSPLFAAVEEGEAA
jgi:DNA modification methylase